MAGGWAFVGTSSTATPGGSDKEVQFNDGGTLGEMLTLHGIKQETS